MMEGILLLDWDRRHWPLAAFFGVWAAGTIVGGVAGHVVAGLIAGVAMGALAAVATVRWLR